MAYYLKYRPQKIADLDNAKLRETLGAVLKGIDNDNGSPDLSTPVKQANSLANARSVPHAFLFTGPKGLGKTSTARIIAKIVNCENRKKGDIEPCNVCESCISITKGNNVDVLEIDGASNRGIDEIRDLREKIKLAPVSSKKKVYIIDEVHMLTTEAFNALLKTIEEPPSHVMFIFCTTEPQKVPATIVSRCFHISLSLATPEELVRSLQRIADGEKLSISKDALSFIAELADGGFRDGSKILEEMAMLANGKEITREFVAERYNVSDIDHLISQFLQNLYEKKTKESLTLIGELVTQGVDIKYFINQLLQALHQLLLREMGLSTTEKYNDIKFSLNEIQILANSLQQAYRDTKFAVVAQLPLEMITVMWCQQEEVKVEKAPFTISSKPTMETLLKKEKNLKVKSILNPEVKKEEKKEETASVQGELPENIDSLTALLENIIYKVKPFNHSVAGVLRGCTITSIGNGQIVFQTAYKFHKEKLMEPKTFDTLAQTIKEVTGKEYKVMIELKQ